jgi:hypothetical protein
VIAEAINAGKAKVTPAEMMAPVNGAEAEAAAPSAEEVAADPQYEVVAARESAGEEVASGTASPPVPAQAATEGEGA